MPPFQLTRTQIIIIGAVLLVVILVAAGLIVGKKEKVAPIQAEIEFWGVFDDSDYYEALIAKFNKIYPKIKIDYRKKDIRSYERELLNALAAGAGPDIFMVGNSWMPRYYNKLQPAPQNVLTALKIQTDFVDAVFNDVVFENKVYAVPLAMDSLVLFWNKDIFNSAGIANPPADWDDFKDDVRFLTKKDIFGNIEMAGAAIGTVSNISRPADILSVLMLQSGTKIFDKETNTAVFDESVTLDSKVFYPGIDALQFYTDFANPQKTVYTWNDQMPQAIDAFSTGKTAMMLGYLYNIPTIKSKAPHLNFGIARLPQIKGVKTAVDFANYWLLGVSTSSKNSQAAWLFLDYASSAEGVADYLNASGKLTARRDLLKYLKNDPEFNVFAEAALTSKSWYQFDNQIIEKVFNDMIESVIKGRLSVEEALSQAVREMNFQSRQF